MDPSPKEITELIFTIVDNHYFEEKQIKLVLVFNSIMAGLGILNLAFLHNAWKVPIVVLSEKFPDNDNIIDLLQKLQYDDEYKKTLLSNPNEWKKLDKTRLFYLPIGISEKEAETIIIHLQKVSQLPEPLRIADIVAKAII